MNSTFWFEKYKPKYVHEIVGQDRIKIALENCLKNKSIPHLLFNGYSGVGKSIIINSFLKEYYGHDNSDMVLYLNSIDERGIKVVRDRINNFSKKSIPESFKSKGIFHKMVILEDAETITNDAQTSLRRCIENYSYITRFCIICNDKSKIIEPIISRCCHFKFNKIKNSVITQKLKDICISENLNYSKESLDKISTESEGDLRRAIIILQTRTYLTGNNIENSTLLNNKEINDDFIENFIEISCNKSHEKILNFNKKIISSGYNLKKIINKLNEYIIYKTNIKNKDKLIFNISNIYRYICGGSDELIQLVFLSHTFGKFFENSNK